MWKSFIGIILNIRGKDGKRSVRYYNCTDVIWNVIVLNFTTMLLCGMKCVNFEELAKHEISFNCYCVQYH